mmetsp:Transcript_43297/g.50124  ORF Transcript_43297/g.50124 Transcript_43297/m.50124 type:complete len:127 (+) Transcript_43297:49-429(+)|eukprot:CAMPEP_0176413974 /NCGR_PEP_ID=MMETSP0127-20121128/4998_1 /TAXON_ID=938130 /ORGANISM="Platyophrya macrostoma, Strain WH" /LENGTH=126 /DNA_ID=CAMNT_0017793817 /DNA_START=55 /DNA_END=435 /DNA_ORIENTATION=-
MMLAAAGLIGFTGVGLGAFGAHGLRNRVSEDRLAAWQTGVHYQLLHAVALLSTSLALKSGAVKAGTKLATRMQLASKLWLAGTLLFSGSIYGLVLSEGQWKFLGPVTPIGGTVMMGGWLAVVAAAL